MSVWLGQPIHLHMARGLYYDVFSVCKVSSLCITLAHYLHFLQLFVAIISVQNCGKLLTFFCWPLCQHGWKLLPTKPSVFSSQQEKACLKSWASVLIPGNVASCLNTGSTLELLKAWQHTSLTLVLPVVLLIILLLISLCFVGCETQRRKCQHRICPCYLAFSAEKIPDGDTTNKENPWEALFVWCHLFFFFPTPTFLQPCDQHL